MDWGRTPKIARWLFPWPAIPASRRELAAVKYNGWSERRPVHQARKVRYPPHSSRRRCARGGAAVLYAVMWSVRLRPPALRRPADVAHQVERRSRKTEAGGSSPLVGSYSPGSCHLAGGSSSWPGSSSSRAGATHCVPVNPQCGQPSGSASTSTTAPVSATARFTTRIPI